MNGMSSQNYTPITDLIAKYQSPSTAPVSKPKEAEPFGKAPEPLAVQEVVEHDTVDESVEKHVEVKKENIQVSPEVAAAGVEPVQSAQFTTLKKIEFPISDDKIMSGLHAPFTSSLRWLATLAVYMLQQTHIHLKMVAGKAVRVED